VGGIFICTVVLAVADTAVEEIGGRRGRITSYIDIYILIYIYIYIYILIHIYIMRAHTHIHTYI